MFKKILVISPHLDDVILSGADYLDQQQKLGHQIVLLTVFTDFAQQKKYQKMRHQEDEKAMSLFNFNFKYFNFTDAGFRSVYPDFKKIFSGKINKQDKILILSLAKKLKKLSNFDEILLPLGVGKHVDHVICKLLGEIIFKSKKIYYYLDWPYALLPKHWTKKLFYFFLKNRKQITWMSSKKKVAIFCYASQIKSLFPLGFYHYPEVIISQRQ